MVETTYSRSTVYMYFITPIIFIENIDIWCCVWICVYMTDYDYMSVASQSVESKRQNFRRPFNTYSISLEIMTDLL